MDEIGLRGAAMRGCVERDEETRSPGPEDRERDQYGPGGWEGCEWSRVRGFGVEGERKGRLGPGPGRRRIADLALFEERDEESGCPPGAEYEDINGVFVGGHFALRLYFRRPM